ncbi:MAG: ABC transporter substrate-binding protein [Deltaproteobacteria bacterium]|nr:ABC transporter substrate-binding protein [Deltaproteobacteria bacterium]
MIKRIFIITLSIILMGSFVFGFSSKAAMAAEKPKYGGILTFNMFPPVATLGNPLKFRGPDHEYIDNTLETLIRPSNEKMGVFEPLLATSWEFAPDKSYCIFKLNKGIKFHDGTDFNAEAVKWNLNQWIKSIRPRLNKVKTIDIIDDYTLKFNLKAWDSVFISDLGKDTYMVSPTAFEKHGEKWADTNPVGTGPFKFKRYKRNTVVTFDRFEGYWKKGLPYLGGLKILMIPDPMTFSAAFQRKDLDAVRVDYILASELRAAGGYDIIALPTGHTALTFNSEDSNSIWSNKKAREALEYAIDKEKVAKVIGKGYINPIYEIVHSVNKIPPGPGTTFRKYNPEKARQLLKEAGVPKGTKVKFFYSTSGPGGSSRDYIVIIMKYLADVGITAVPEGLSSAAFTQKNAQPPLPNELIASGQRGSANELLISVDETLGPGSLFFKGIKKPEGFYKLLDKALQTDDFDTTVKYLYEMERLAYADAMFVPVLEQSFIVVQHPHVKDAVWWWGAMPYPNHERTWLDK